MLDGSVLGRIDFHCSILEPIFQALAEFYQIRAPLLIGDALDFFWGVSFE